MLETALADLSTLLDGLLAIALGGVVGWERERHGKGAGFRTMMLVSFSSFLFVTVSLAAVPPGDASRSDPIRAIQAVATGLGFVGAGLVFRDAAGGRTRGITTAAALLAVAPLGIAVAVGHPVLAIGSTALVMLILSAGDRVEQRYLDGRP